jgi:multicomponent Na+:H+ antiporter subunit D
VYQEAPSQVSAILSGITKKVGIYAMIRIFFTILPSDIPAANSILFGNLSILAFFGAILFILSASSIIFGGLAALSETNLDRILAYSSISQAGFILLPLSIGALFPVFKHLAIVATIIFMLNHSIAKSSLFIASGYIKQITGSLNLSELSGIHKSAPILSLSFLICMVSLIGIPPSIGFFGKLYLLIMPAHALSSNPYSSIFIVSIIIIGTLLSLLYFTRIWNMIFWGEISPIVASVKFPILGQYLILFSAILLIVFGMGFDLMFSLIDSAAFSAMDSSGYIDAVLYNK